jgi:hypothetical protein
MQRELIDHMRQEIDEKVSEFRKCKGENFAHKKLFDMCSNNLNEHKKNISILENELKEQDARHTKTITTLTRTISDLQSNNNLLQNELRSEKQVFKNCRGLLEENRKEFENIIKQLREKLQICENKWKVSDDGPDDIFRQMDEYLRSFEK